MIKIDERFGVAKEMGHIKTDSLVLLNKYKGIMADKLFIHFLIEILFEDKFINNVAKGFEFSDKEALSMASISNRKIIIYYKTLFNNIKKFLDEVNQRGHIKNSFEYNNYLNLLVTRTIYHEYIHLIADLINLNIIKTDETISSIYKIELLLRKEKNSFIYDEEYDNMFFEKAANCYSIEMVTELLNEELISPYNMNYFNALYLKFLLGQYQYDAATNHVIGECELTYLAFNKIKKYQKLNINMKLPLYIRMSNGILITRKELETVNSIIAKNDYDSAKQKIMQL